MISFAENINFAFFWSVLILDISQVSVSSWPESTCDKIRGFIENKACMKSNVGFCLTSELLEVQFLVLYGLSQEVISA